MQWSFLRKTLELKCDLADKCMHELAENFSVDTVECTGSLYKSWSCDLVQVARVGSGAL